MIFNEHHTDYDTLLLIPALYSIDINKLLVWLFPFIYHRYRLLICATPGPRRRLVVTGDSARIQEETTESSAWFFNVLRV